MRNTDINFVMVKGVHQSTSVLIWNTEGPKPAMCVWRSWAREISMGGQEEGDGPNSMFNMKMSLAFGKWTCPKS